MKTPTREYIEKLACDETIEFSEYCNLWRQYWDQNAIRDPKLCYNFLSADEPEKGLCYNGDEMGQCEECTEKEGAYWKGYFGNTLKTFAPVTTQDTINYKNQQWLDQQDPDTL
jgi:hypothetical protein